MSRPTPIDERPRRRTPAEHGAALAPLPRRLPDAEVQFYGEYPWCLDTAPTVGQAASRLASELGRVGQVPPGWQRSEVLINTFLLACGITDAVDDYLADQRYDFSRLGSVLPLAGPAVRAAAAMSKAWQAARRVRLSGFHRWRKAWGISLDEYLRLFVADAQPASQAFADVTARLSSQVRLLPTGVGRRRLRIPAAFRTQDLTHVDVLALAERLATVHAGRQTPTVVVGLRTAGSYFAPLVCASLANAGYGDVRWITIRPKRQITQWERQTLVDVARRGGVAAIVDEPPNSGGTIAMATGLVRSCGFEADRQFLAVPIHPTVPDWAKGPAVVPLRGVRIVTLEAGEWHKVRSLSPENAERRIVEYFLSRGYDDAKVVASPAAAARNARLRRSSEERFHTRLKQVYEVQARMGARSLETRFVIAKSVGWGWLGYHAFTAAQRLSPMVPPVLGLRDGVLYAEWLFDAGPDADVGRNNLVSALARYSGARARTLALDHDLSADLARADQHKGSAVLAEALSRAYGWKPAALLKRPRIRRELIKQHGGPQALIDGKMRPQEWVASGGDVVKTDFEHHGLGKTELNVTDPAYDLADAILQFGLSPDEEESLVREFIDASGDTGVTTRLFLHKLLAGLWAMHNALDSVEDARLAPRHQEFNELYLAARRFLTIQTTRRCAATCRPASTQRWQSPLVVLDIDGVLDRLIFGFPSTTAAGVEAVSLLHSHNLAVALNTARTLSEVKEYCRAYGFLGGVAEYGCVVWDGVTGRERVLVSNESQAQVERVKAALRQVPGVFLDEAYVHSIRAHAFERRTTVPLPTILVRNLLRDVGADRVTFHQTFVDTTILPREVDKGLGLTALLCLTGQEGACTMAVGDSEADLPMFGAANASFAPSHLTCRTQARLLGCRIVDRPFQAGFLRAVRSIVHPDAAQCPACRGAAKTASSDDGDVFTRLLRLADEPRWRLLLRAVTDPMAVQTFVR